MQIACCFAQEKISHLAVDLHPTICISMQTLWPSVALLAFDSLPVTLVSAGVLRLPGQCARAGAAALPPLSTYTAGAPLDTEGQR